MCETWLHWIYEIMWMHKIWVDTSFEKRSLPLHWVPEGYLWFYHLHLIRQLWDVQGGQLQLVPNGPAAIKKWHLFHLIFKSGLIAEFLKLKHTQYCALSTYSIVATVWIPESIAFKKHMIRSTNFLAYGRGPRISMNPGFCWSMFIIIGFCQMNLLYWNTN